MAEKPDCCPFCEGTDVSIRKQGKNGYRVACNTCGAMGPYVPVRAWHVNKFIAQGQAVRKWNRRNCNGLY